MGSLFGKPTSSQAVPKHVEKPGSAITEKDRAILDLKNARDRLKKYRKKLEKDSETLLTQAKQLIHQQQKTRALLVLKLRRFKDNEVDKVDGELMSVLEMIETVEWEHANMEVLRALKAGTASLNKLHDEMSLDDVSELLEETNQAIEVENSINEMLAGQMNIGDNAELERELAELMGETASASTAAQLDLPAVPNAPILPSVPVSGVAGNTKTSSTAGKQAAMLS